MASNKKIVYLLVVVFVLVWGYIFYKIYDYLSPDDQPQQTFQNHVISDTTSTEKSFHVLSLNYKDPFLGKQKMINRNQINSQNKKKDKPPLPIKTAKTVKWPKIEYKGTIRDNNEKKEIAFIKINDKYHFIKQKEIIDNVAVEEIFKDSIYINFENERKVFVLGE